MTSVKVKFRSSSVSGRDGTLFYQVIHLRQVRQIYTTLHIRDTEWDSVQSTVIIPVGCDSLRASFLIAVKEQMKSDKRRLDAIISDFERAGKKYEAEDVVNEYCNPGSIAGFLSFSVDLIEEMRKIGKKKAVRRFSAALASLKRYVKSEEISWVDFNSTLISGYEEYLLSRGLCRNTTSFYMRNLRAIANRAADKDYNVPRNPFRYVYMGVDKTVKRAISLKNMCRIKEIDLSAYPLVDFARNVFMFSFYMRGMSFVDIAYLRKSDMQSGVISYRRRKTGQLIQVKLESQAMRIIERMGCCQSGYLLPIITDEYSDDERQYMNAYHKVNRNLKKLGDLLGLDARLTMYVARHAWASIAKSHNIPIATISEAMGHDSETTTRIYLSSLDASSIDKANSKIIKLMNEPV